MSAELRSANLTGGPPKRSLTVRLWKSVGFSFSAALLIILSVSSLLLSSPVRLLAPSYEFVSFLHRFLCLSNPIVQFRIRCH